MTKCSAANARLSIRSVKRMECRLYHTAMIRDSEQYQLKSHLSIQALSDGHMCLSTILNCILTLRTLECSITKDSDSVRQSRGRQCFLILLKNIRTCIQTLHSTASMRMSGNIFWKYLRSQNRLTAQNTKAV